MNELTNKLLLDESPVIVLPTLAVVLESVDKAIFLQQLHFWMMYYKNDTAHQRDGYVWVWNTYNDWHKQMRWNSIATIRRIVESLEEGQTIITTSKYNRSKNDNTKWYTINYAVLDGLLKSTVGVLKMSSPPAQNEQSDVLKMSSRMNTENTQKKQTDTTNSISDVDLRKQEPHLEQFILQNWGRAWTVMGWEPKQRLLRLMRDEKGIITPERRDLFRQAIEISANAGESAKTVRFVTGVFKKWDAERLKEKVSRFGIKQTQDSQGEWRSYCGKILPANSEYEHKQNCEICRSESDRRIKDASNQTLREMGLKV